MLTRSLTKRAWPWLVAILTGTLLAFAPATSATALGPVTPQIWHRNNIFEPLGPSHERLRCLTDGQWRCQYDTVPEPTIGFSNPRVKGTFVGTDVTNSFACPQADWFPTQICRSVTQAIAGTQTFTDPGRGTLFDVQAVLLVLDDGSLWDYWVDILACPWYPTFNQALTSPAGCSFSPEFTLP